MTGPWEVSFDPRWGGPGTVVFQELEDWITRAEEGVKYYSGTAIYRKTFDAPDAAATYLDLGAVKNLAHVRLNGEDLGIVWTAPWRVNVGKALRAKGNRLEIEVVNLWPNRLIGDGGLPKQDQAHQDKRENVRAQSARGLPVLVEPRLRRAQENRSASRPCFPRVCLDRYACWPRCVEQSRSVWTLVQ